MNYERIIYTTEFTEDEKQDAREFIFEYDDCNDWKSSDDVPQDTIYSYLMAQKEADTDDFLMSANAYFRDHGENGYVVFGTIGRWNGTSEGGMIFDTFNDFNNLELLKDCNIVEWFDRNNHLYVHGVHHDGEVNLEIKELTKRGLDYVSRNGCNHQLITYKPYTRLPKEVWKLGYEG